MRTIIIALGLWLAAMLPALAMSPIDAASHVGENVTVEGVVAEVFTDDRSDTTFLDFGAPYPDQTFTAVIFAEDRASFSDVSSAEGRAVEITGTVDLYKGRPEIVLRDAAQLTIE